MRLPFAARRRLCSSANPSLRPELLREDAVLFEEVLEGLLLLAVEPAGEREQQEPQWPPVSLTLLIAHALRD